MATTPLSTPVRLSTTTFGTLWDYYGDLSPIPTPLHISVPLRYGDSVSTAERRAFAELDAATLMTREHPHPDLRATLLLLSRSARRYYGWFGDDNGSIGAIVAANDDAAVLAVKNGDIVHLEPVDPTAASSRLVALLPPLPAAAGTRIVFHPDTPEDASISVLNPVNGRRTPRNAAELLAAPRSGGAQLHVQVGSTRSPSAAHVLDVAAGRWLLTERHGTVTIEPADAARIGRYLDASAAALA